MIIGMSKVEIAGPKGRLLEVLALIRREGIVQLETDIHGLVPEDDARRVRTLLLDESELSAKLFYEDFSRKVHDLFALLPPTPLRQTYFDPAKFLPLLAQLLPRHMERCRSLQNLLEECRASRDELRRFVVLLPALRSLVEGVDAAGKVELIGVTVRRPELLDVLREAVSQAVGSRFDMLTAVAEDGTQVALLVTEAEQASRLREALERTKMAELSFPAELSGLPLAKKIASLGDRLEELAAQQHTVEAALEQFARQWKPIYASSLELVEERLAVLQATSQVYETDLCFVLIGWMPARQIDSLRARLQAEFEGEVVLEELALLAEDLERVPVLLRNPRYFAPFEIFSRLLPLPAYASFDPTPFMAIFFPLIFGMILGDVVYGLVLLLLALVLLWWFKNRPLVRDGARILGVCAAYTILFGFLYGEFLGELGGQVLGLEPLLFDRARAIVPTIWFALSVGLVHVVLGLLFGAVSAFRQRHSRQALFKLLTAGVMVGVAGLVAFMLLTSTELELRPLLVTVAVLIPLLFLAGGLLAPLELLKSIGNIISYVRIMAIGLSSVLLAHVANRLGGMSGDILVGTLVAVLLHAFNLLLGVFAPTIHGLRLHYVEFFSKFIEGGGRPFAPLRKKREP
ncbi:ATPase [Desulfuromonas sp. KJ2020]|uniref:V-type ATP synthase subunit I n=1 Tax=Desulfuromonas sp. KJ2020 TaxID=2919173 RepID=UPI0020A763B8|nr:V-type ATPase 116kDa subunit family protein [Desulfuromonas sp. KJ2020]MCP3176038.1 ATPase [Desulfuromonas sp. KJ2020]